MPDIISADDVRPLPPKPDLEAEILRAQQIVDASDGKLDEHEARLLVARNYGFASWEILERYFAQWELHLRTRIPGWKESVNYESAVRQILLEFKNRAAMPTQPPDIIGTGSVLSTYVPRFYGLSDAEIFSDSVTESETQLVVARRYRFSSWAALKEAEAAYIRPTPSPQDLERIKHRKAGPVTFAHMTDGSDDRERLVRLFTADRRMFEAVTETGGGDAVLWRMAFLAINQLPDKHEMLSWIKSLGIDVQTPLNICLLGWSLLSPDESDATRALLELGADPHWTPHNGISVLEHALVRHGSGASVDLIAARVKARRTFWIAAGLGDVATMQSYFERDGTLSRAAHDDRPDFVAMDSIQLSGVGRPNGSELHVMWEAFIVAVMNSRLNTVTALLDHGLPPDYSPVWMNALHFCVNYDYLDIAQLLLSRGANPDFKAWPDCMSPRGMAKILLDGTPANRTAQLVFDLGAK